MRKHELPDEQRSTRLCAGCSHAEFAHTGEQAVAQDTHSAMRGASDVNTSCDLCMCRAFVGTVVRGDIAPDFKR